MKQLTMTLAGLLAVSLFSCSISEEEGEQYQVYKRVSYLKRVQLIDKDSIQIADDWVKQGDSAESDYVSGENGFDCAKDSLVRHGDSVFFPKGYLYQNYWTCSDTMLVYLLNDSGGSFAGTYRNGIQISDRDTSFIDLQINGDTLSYKATLVIWTWWTSLSGIHTYIPTMGWVDPQPIYDSIVEVKDSMVLKTHLFEFRRILLPK